MSRATTLARVADLSRSQADAIIAGRFYDDVVYQMGAEMLLTQATLVEVDRADATAELPDTVLKVLHVFWDDIELSEESLTTLEWVDPFWKDRESTPSGYVTLGESEGTLRLYPAPEVSSADFTFAFGAPFGVGFPAYSLLVIHTEKRENVPAWLEMIVALQILVYEYGRESNHRDTQFAAACGTLGQMLRGMVN